MFASGSENLENRNSVETVRWTKCDWSTGDDTDKVDACRCRPEMGEFGFVVVDNILKGSEKKTVTEGERDNEKVSGSVYRFWSLELVSLQPLRCRSRLIIISAALPVQYLLSTVQPVNSRHCLSAATSALRAARGHAVLDRWSHAASRQRPASVPKENRRHGRPQSPSLILTNR